MRKFRILIHDIGILTPDFDYRQSGAKGLYPLLQELHRMLDVEEVWVYFKGGSECSDDNSNAYRTSCFRDGLDLIDKLKPDLILTRSDYEFLTRGIILASRYKSIPSTVVVSIRPYVSDNENSEVHKIIKGRISWLFTNSKSIINRYVFLLNTIRRCRLGFTYLISTIISDFYLSLKTLEPTNRLGIGDLYLANNTGWRDRMIKHGVDDKKIIVVGECAMDLVYDKLESMKEGVHEKTNILFITQSMVEHGVWTPNMRDKLVIEVVKAIATNFPDSKFTIKIHPGEPLQHYKNLAESVNPMIEVIENADLLSLIKNSDILIGMGGSTAMFGALLLRKPIFIINLYDEERINFLITEKLAKECKTIDELIEGIKGANFVRPDSAQLQAFIERQFYKFDGNCSKRAAEAIIRLLTERYG